MNIGEKIKQLRTDKNLTQPQLAEAIGIEQSYLSKLENDKSVPSADIFQAILKALAVNVANFLEGIDEKIIHKDLRQIPEVANYLQAGVTYKIHNIKKWLYSSAAACVIGLTLIVAGYKSLIFQSTLQEYSSEGVIRKGEPDTIYRNLDSYLSTLGCNTYVPNMSGDQKCIQIKREVLERQKFKTLLLPEYQGRAVYEDVQDGIRAYFYRGTSAADDRPNRWLSLIGCLLLFSGLFGFFVEFRLRKI